MVNYMKIDTNFPIELLFKRKSSFEKNGGYYKVGSRKSVCYKLVSVYAYRTYCVFDAMLYSGSKAGYWTKSSDIRKYEWYTQKLHII